MNLPSAEAERIEEEDKTVVAVLTEKGEIFLDGDKVAKEDLENKFRDLQEKTKRLMLILQADEKAMHGQVVVVMDTAKQCGITRLAIATRHKSTSLKEP